MLIARTALLALAVAALSSTAEAFRKPTPGAPGIMSYVPVQPFTPRPHGGPTFTTKPAVQITNAEATSPQEQAIALAKKLYGTALDISVDYSYTTEHNGITHVYLKQALDGVPISNADLTVNIQHGQIISHGGMFMNINKDALSHVKRWMSASSSTEFKRPRDAVQALANHLQLGPSIASIHTMQENKGPKGSYTISNVAFSKTKEANVARAYIQDKDGNLVPAWKVQVPMKENWFTGHVKADSEDVLALSDAVKYLQDPKKNASADTATLASYRVVKLGDDNPKDTPETLVANPFFINSSPLMWHDQGNGKKFTSTIGNNVYAQENWSGGDTWDGNKRPDGGAALKFDFPYNLKATDPKTNINSAVTDLFYWNNMMHDVMYQFGFDEKAGNFQENNLSKGGSGGDAVIAFAQDGTGMDNANFATPPDGDHGVMRMYVFDTTTPETDGDFETAIISHEYMHGVTNRLVGGPQNTDCLNDGQSGGMGEGWYDF